MKLTRVLIAASLLIFSGLPAAAQQRQAPPPGEFADPGADSQPSPERREEIRKKIEAVRMWRMMEELRLDDATSSKLSSILSSQDQRRREIMKGQMELMQELRALLRPQKPDDNRLKSALDRIEQNHRDMQELRNRELKDIRTLLTVEQQARFLIFQQEFQREMRDLITGARGVGQGRGMGQGMGPGRGPNPDGQRRRSPQD